MSSKKYAKSASQTNSGKEKITKVIVKNDDLGDWVTPKTGEKFYINEDAEFPSIAFEIVTTENGPYKWSWEISWDACVSGLREKPRGKKLKRFSEAGQFESTIKKWDANTITKVIGGTLVVKVKTGSKEFKRTVLILGTQPTTEKIQKYLISKDASTLDKIIAQESQYKHLINLDSEPVVSFDGGYGLSQMTSPAPSFEQVWSWKKNLEAGIVLSKSKQNDAKKYLSKYGKDSYTSEMVDREAISRWNSGSYYVWNTKEKKWIRNPDIICDTTTGNIGWVMTNEENKGKTEQQLHERDKEKYKSGSDGQSATNPWSYKGVCYADHIEK